MIWISDFRRGQPDWYYRQNARNRPSPGPGPERKPSPGASAPPPPPPRGGLAGTLEHILPEGLDPGDLFLAAMLLFLYSESRDEDFLIILIVVGISLFHKDKPDE